MKCDQCGREGPGSAYETDVAGEESVFLCHRCVRRFYDYRMLAMWVGTPLLVVVGIVVTSMSENFGPVCFIGLVAQYAILFFYWPLLRASRGGATMDSSKPAVLRVHASRIARRRAAQRPLEYVRDDGWPVSGDGRCSDNACPCPEPGTLIPRGRGYLYIPTETAALRKEFREPVEARAEMHRRISQNAQQIGINVIATFRTGPILVCEQGARLRQLNLRVAAQDAERWWETGEFPLRATPTA